MFKIKNWKEKARHGAKTVGIDAIVYFLLISMFFYSL